MKNITLPLFLSFLTFGIILSSCNTSQKEFSEINDFSPYISGFTSGAINSNSRILIRLTDPVEPSTESNQSIEKNPFDFEPNIQGSAIWLDNQTIAFIPDENLISGTEYHCQFKLDQFVEVDDNFGVFKFGFKTITQHLNIEVQSIQNYSNNELGWQFMEGLLKTEDQAGNQNVERVLEASQNGKELSISWRHESNGLYHYFTVDSISRQESKGIVSLSWDGKPVGSEDIGKLEKEIPALGDFKLIDVGVNQHPEQCLIIQFSDPLLATQNLDGLVSIQGVNSISLLIEGNVIRAYPGERLKGEQKLEIASGIKNVLGKKLNEPFSSPVQFEAIKPQIQFLVSKPILPSSTGLSIPFKAVSLKAVDVKVIRVFEKNVHQFLQINELTGSDQMRRVGRVIRKKTVYLNNNEKMDLGSWQTFQLDLKDLIAPEKGAIYRIEIGFRKSHSLYDCKESDLDDTEEQDWNSFEDKADDVIQNYRYYDDYYWDDYYDYDYDWKERDNPCHDMYYRNRGPISINILASDIGLIAKAGTNGSWNFFATNLITAAPLSGANLTVYNFQNQVLSKVTCDAEGKAQIDKLDGQPFLLVATKDGEKGYLKLARGGALSLSKFDVSGQRIQKGLKGFIYGDRGVWRPGDTLFLGFMLEDASNRLPENHPVVLELRDPQGKLVNRINKTVGQNGVYLFEVQTDVEAPTGNWRARIAVGGTSFEKRLRIETIKPNRLKVKIDFGKDIISVADSVLEGALQVNWLHGAPGRNLRTKIGVTFRSIFTRFEGHDPFVFDDPSRRYVAEEKIIFDSRVKEDGSAPLNLALDFSKKPAGKLMAYFDSKAFEEGGEFSIDHFQMPYAPYSSFVGIALDEGKRQKRTLETDEDHRFDVVSVTPDGNPVSNQKLAYKVYKMSWRWWWERNNDDLSNFVGGQGALPVAEGELTTGKNGKGSFNVQIKYPEWGRYLVRVVNQESGHATGRIVYIDWPGWANQSTRQSQDGAQMLMFNTNKEKYNVGEKCTVTFPSSTGSRALLTIESGDEVIQAHWIDTKETSTSYEFKVQEGMAPNVFVHISLLQPHSQTKNNAPMRLYGVMPISVEDPGTRLNPQLQMPKELKPEEEFDVTISEANGKKMTFTLAIVDEGLLDLTRFKTPDPHSHFYAKEALGVTTWDMFDQVINAQNGPMGQLLSIGGDGENNEQGKNKANRFKPVVLFSGPITIDKGQSKKLTFKMPNYVGSVRAMLIARDNEAYGNTEKTLPVRKPLMVLATLPRVVGPEEEVVLPVTVFAMDAKVKNVEVTIKHNDLFETVSSSKQTITFDAIGDQIVPFKLKVKKRIGIGTVEVIAKSGNETAHYDFEIDVRNPNPFTTVSKLEILEKTESFAQEIDLIGMQGTNVMSLEVSSIPPINLEERMSYLLGYPHGCVEQTTSKAFPQIYLEDLADLSEQQKMRAKMNIRDALQKLKFFQQPNGGFSYWPGRYSCNDWGTTYAGHFILEAESKGYDLPIGLKSNWISYQKEIARNWRRPRSSSGYRYSYEDLMQAYRLYTLALANAPDLASMNRLREQHNMSAPCRWKLAAAYQLAGQTEVAEELTQGLTTHVSPYRSLTGHYGSNWRDMAMILETLTLMNKRDEAALVLREVAEQLSSQRWMSTQATSYSLVAIAHFLGEQEKGPLECTITWNGKKENLLTNMPILIKDLDASKISQNKLLIENTGNKLIYTRWVNRGQPLHGNEVTKSNDVGLSISYFTANGDGLDISKIEQGTDFIAKVVVHNQSPAGDLHEMALTQIFPSGWEIINQRLSGTRSISYNSDYSTYQDIRDDRVLTYYNLGTNGKRTYYVRLNAAYLGKYYLPGISTEAMYDASINAMEKGRWVEVVQSGK